MARILLCLCSLLAAASGLVASLPAAEVPILPAVSAAVQPFVDRDEFAGVVTLVGRGSEIIHLQAIGQRPGRE